MASTAKCTRVGAGAWKNPKNTDGIPPLGNNTLNCDCSACKSVFKDTVHWTSTHKENSDIVIKIGDRVLVHGCLPGVVRYVGDLDSNYTNDQVYIGVKLDDPVGNNDGTLNNKRYFTCPEKHGMIVPIEQVHILVPKDGRSIQVNPCPANKFYSMPEMADLESITSSRTDSPSEQPQLLRGVSDGCLSSSHVTPMATPTTTPITSKMSLDDVSMLMEEHMTRSTVFVCNEPGSIAAGVEVSESVKSLLRKNASDAKVTSDKKSADDDSEAEVLESEKETTDDGKSDKASDTEVPQPSKTSSLKTVESGCTAAESAKKVESKQNRGLGTAVSSKTSHQTVPSLYQSGRKLNVSSSVPMASTGSHFSKLKLATSQSASGSVSTKKPSVSSISTLATTKLQSTVNIASQPPSSSKSIQEHGSQKMAITEVMDIEVEDTEVSPPEVPRLAFVPEPEQQTSSEPPTQRSLQTSLVPKPSYTTQLLSSLPLEEDMTPLSASTQLGEVMQFGDWVDTWGGGMKGWVMAQTLQKLKDAERRGAKEVLWQKTIDELEMDDEFAARIRHIRVLREEIAEVQKMQAAVDQELRESKIAMSASQLRKEIESIQDETKLVQKMNEDLVEKIQANPLFEVVGEALQQFGIL